MSLSFSLIASVTGLTKNWLPVNSPVQPTHFRLGNQIYIAIISKSIKLITELTLLQEYRYNFKVYFKIYLEIFIKINRIILENFRTFLSHSWQVHLFLNFTHI